MILMADLEITNSASVLLSAASTLADPYSCCAAATFAGLGILHGGAIEVAYKQLDTLRDLREVPLLIERVPGERVRAARGGVLGPGELDVRRSLGDGRQPHPLAVLVGFTTILVQSSARFIGLRGRRKNRRRDR